MKYQAPETFLQPPTILETGARHLRNAAVITGLVCELIDFDVWDPADMKRNLSLLAVAGIAEAARYAEYHARNL